MRRNPPQRLYVTPRSTETKTTAETASDNISIGVKLMANGFIEQLYIRRKRKKVKLFYS
jgi:hypothetical protein